MQPSASNAIARRQNFSGRNTSTSTTNDTIVTKPKQADNPGTTVAKMIRKGPGAKGDIHEWYPPGVAQLHVDGSGSSGLKLTRLQ